MMAPAVVGLAKLQANGGRESDTKATAGLLTSEDLMGLKRKSRKSVLSFSFVCSEVKMDKVSGLSPLFCCPHPTPFYEEFNGRGK